jgi:hypothetical protein
MLLLQKSNYSYSRMREFNSLASVSTIFVETLSKVSDIIAINKFSIMIGINIAANVNKHHIAEVKPNGDVPPKSNKNIL